MMKNSIIFLILIFLYSEKLCSQVPSIEWQKTFGSGSHNQANSIQHTSDNGYIVAGYKAGPFNPSDFYILKLDSTGNIQWQKEIGGSSSDEALCIIQSTDGGYVVTGTTLSNDGNVLGNHGSVDYWVVKLDSNGNIIWQKTLGGTKEDFAHSIKNTSDGGYIIAGATFSNDGNVLGNHSFPLNSDCWIVKLKNNGDIAWQKTFGGSLSESANDIEQTTDGGYVITGETNSTDGDITLNKGGSDFWVVKISDLGNIAWQKTFGGSLNESAKSIKQSIDGGYIVAGYSQSNNGDLTTNKGEFDYCVIKLSSTGNIQWQKTLGGSYYDYARGIIQTADGGYVIAGETNSNDGDVTGNHIISGIRYDFWITKLNNSGILQWQKTLGGYTDDGIYSISNADNNSYVLAGVASSSTGDVTSGPSTGLYSSYWIVKLGSEVLNAEDYIKKDLSFRIYPNPASKVLNIDSDKTIDMVAIIDLSGKKIFEQKNNSKIINIQNIEKGIYLLRIYYEDKVATFKFTKE